MKLTKNMLKGLRFRGRTFDHDFTTKLRLLDKNEGDT